ncbi:hypothetical protein G3N58_04490 [Paraburkholderia sp. Ac-20342]|uniref:hypothetical protein n=1 Tax=Paraburkholderia sp. Ac-20342 TaxID=2703889 RepID=UPI00197EB28D|nr:hypothetical protein [Paraburkholderia sp. Ac-20342]MBN3846093.1 hypothetical protein [Paraburkholderia sp. Ac-20342]
MVADGHIFQITQAAALMCEHLPMPNSFDFISTLHDWQDLAGAIIGALMGVVGALIVATRGTRRERRSAASTVFPEIYSLRAQNDQIVAAVNASHLTKARKKRLVCDMLIRARPTINALHSAVVTQLYDIDTRLFLHIINAHRTHEEFEPRLEQYREARNEARAPHPSPEDVSASELKLDICASQATWAWGRCVEHAILANYYLDRFVFSSWPNWILCLRMRFFPNDLDRRSEYILDRGELLSEAKETTKPALDEQTPI